jgi:hypothetical protein
MDDFPEAKSATNSSQGASAAVTKGALLINSALNLASKHGSIKLGGSNAKPEESDFDLGEGTTVKDIMEEIEPKTSMTDFCPDLTTEVWIKWLQTACILLATYKLLWGLRFYKGFIHIVYMLSETLKKLFHFTFILFLGLIVASLI